MGLHVGRQHLALLALGEFRGTKDDICIRILHSGSKAKYKGHTYQKSCLVGSCVYVVFWGPENLAPAADVQAPWLKSSGWHADCHTASSFIGCRFYTCVYGSSDMSSS